MGLAGERPRYLRTSRALEASRLRGPGTGKGRGINRIKIETDVEPVNAIAGILDRLRDGALDALLLDPVHPEPPHARVCGGAHLIPRV